MTKLLPILLMCFGVTAALAQTARSDVTMSTDPAKVAAVEKHAAELKARAAQQQAVPGAKTAAKARTSTAAKAQAKRKTGATKKPAATK
jgi:hypothetical protein